MNSEQIEKLVAAANSTNALASEIGTRKLSEMGLDKNGKPISSAVKKDEPKIAKVKSTKPKPAKPKAETPPQKQATAAEEYDCDVLIEQVERRRKKAKERAAKLASMPKKTQATKNKEAIEKAADRVEKNVEKRVKKGDVSVEEIKKLIAEYEDAIAKLKALLERAEGKMARGGDVSSEEVEHILNKARGVKEQHCGCGGEMARGGMTRAKREYNKSVDLYAYYIVDTMQKRAVEGYEFKNDAAEALAEYEEHAPNRYKVVAKSRLASMGIANPNEYFKSMQKGGRLVRHNGREFPTGSAWTKEHNERNKAEPWEQQFAKGGGVKGVTSVEYEDNGDTMIYGSKNLKTKVSVKGLTQDAIREELEFEEMMLGKAKQNLQRAVQGLEELRTLRHVTDEEKKDAQRQIDRINRGIEVAEQFVLPFYRSKIEKYARGGKLVRHNGREYPTGSAWTKEHNERNKAEPWEQQFAKGGGVGVMTAQVGDEIEYEVKYAGDSKLRSKGIVKSKDGDHYKVRITSRGDLQGRETDVHKSLVVNIMPKAYAKGGGIGVMTAQVGDEIEYEVKYAGDSKLRHKGVVKSKDGDYYKVRITSRGDLHGRETDVHKSLVVNIMPKAYAKGGGIGLQIGSRIGFLEPKSGRYQWADVLSIEGDEVKLVARHPRKKQWDNYFSETLTRLSEFSKTESDNWKDRRPVVKIQYARGGKMQSNEEDDYGTFEMYKRGGSVEVKIVNKDRKFDKSQYKWLVGDLDKDGVANADDHDPLNRRDKGTIDSPSLRTGLNTLLDLKKAMDKNMYAFVRKLKDAAPDDSKIYARTKTPYSIINKLISKRLLNPKTGLTDLVGTTIVVKTKSGLEEVKKQILAGKLGRVIEVEDMYEKPKDGYRAVHFLVEQNGMPVELQLKTARQKALNELSHEPYKLGQLDGEKLLRMSAIADKADNGDKKAIAEHNEFMSQPQIERAFYLEHSGKMAKGGGVAKKPSRREMLSYMDMYFEFYDELHTITDDEYNIITKNNVSSLDADELEMAYYDAKNAIRAETQFAKGGGIQDEELSDEQLALSRRNNPKLF